MMAPMSFSNAPDERTLGRVAGALGVDEAFVEKDWYVVQAIQTLIGRATPDLTPAFSGGTSLLKAHGLIRRFSEDIDFKLNLSDAFVDKSQGQKRSALSAFKNGLADAWAAAGFVITGIEAGSGNGFIQIDMDYPTILKGHDALRTHIQAEISAKPPQLATGKRPLTSFVHQYRGLDPEIPAIACVDPVETAADKLSAFCWRVLTRDRERATDDPTIVRHLHDLAALEAVVVASEKFPSLAEATMIADSNRGGGALSGMYPAERVTALLEHLRTDALYADEYSRFVGGMAFAGNEEVASYDLALESLERLCGLVPAK